MANLNATLTGIEPYNGVEPLSEYKSDLTLTELKTLDSLQMFVKKMQKKGRYDSVKIKNDEFRLVQKLHGVHSRYYIKHKNFVEINFMVLQRLVEKIVDIHIVEIKKAVG